MRNLFLQGLGSVLNSEFCCKMISSTCPSAQVGMMALADLGQLYEDYLPTKEAIAS